MDDHDSVGGLPCKLLEQGLQEEATLIFIQIIEMDFNIVNEGNLCRA